MRIFLGIWAVFLLFGAGPSWAQSSCNAPPTDTVTLVPLSGGPFAAIPSPDGCTIYVSLTEARRIEVLGRAGGHVTLARDVAVGDGLTGMAMSHDGKVLAATDGKGVVLFDTEKLKAGDGTPLAQAKDQAVGAAPGAASVYVAVSRDDKLLFVSDEAAAALTVYDLAKLRQGDTTAIGRIPVGIAPVGLVFSPDGKRLYNTSEVGQPGTTPAICPAEAGEGGTTPQGLITVIDVERAGTAPAESVLAKVPGGCDPVRIALSKDGGKAFVTARGEDAVLVFDTAKLVGDASHALVATIKVGKSPVGVAAANGRVIAADSNRFAARGRKGEWLSVIDAAGGKALGNVPAGLFPRELLVTADGRSLLVTNFLSNSLELVDLPRLTPAYFAQEKPLVDADNAQQAKADADRRKRIAAKEPSPGTEAALRKIIPGLAAGDPDYDMLSPPLADEVRANIKMAGGRIAKLGELKSLDFVTITPGDDDVYLANFAQGKLRFVIGLSPDGKIGDLYFANAN